MKIPSAACCSESVRLATVALSIQDILQHRQRKADGGIKPSAGRGGSDEEKQRIHAETKRQILEINAPELPECGHRNATGRYFNQG